jgi:hypothetical protein
MYNSKYKCRYNNELDDLILDNININDFEKEYLRDILYREDLLNIFSLNDENFYENLDKIIIELYNKISSNLDLRECMKIMAASLMSENEELGLCLLYSFDYMDLTHQCISELLENGTITEYNLKLLKDKINSGKLS